MVPVKKQYLRLKPKTFANEKEARTLIVCQLSSRHNPTDERILHRMARTALECGYESFFVVPHKRTSIWHGVTLIPCPKVPFSGEKRRRWLASLSILWWAIKSKGVLFQIHDPDLIPAGILLKILGRRVIYDIHDDYQTSFIDRLRQKPWFVGWLPRFWWWFERNAARAFDGVVVADRHLAKKFAHCKPVILGNYPPLDFAVQADQKVKETFNLIYVGGVTRPRGVEVALSALRKLPMPELRLHIIGSCPDQELRSSLLANSRVVYHGRVEWNSLSQFYSKAHVGFALYQPLDSFFYSPGENAVKIMEYMASGIPVVTADFPGLREFVEGNEIGLVVNPTCPEQVAGVVNKLIQDKELRVSLGTNGRRLFETKYNWDAHKYKLIELYDRIVFQQ